MRIYAEFSVGFQNLLKLDREEAVGNHDSAFEAILEAFHTFYDITKENRIFEYFKHADTSLIINLRNAIHHRDHDLFISWNRMMIDMDKNIMNGASFLMVNYSMESLNNSKYFLSFYDFYKWLDRSRNKNKINTLEMWDVNLGFSKIKYKTTSDRYPEKQVYINIFPIFLSAVRRVSEWMSEAEIIPTRFDGDVYFKHFINLELPDIGAPQFSRLQITA